MGGLPAGHPVSSAIRDMMRSSLSRRSEALAFELTEVGGPTQSLNIGHDIVGTKIIIGSMCLHSLLAKLFLGALLGSLSVATSLGNIFSW